jgi:AraC-like DNA-binding protein
LESFDGAELELAWEDPLAEGSEPHLAGDHEGLEASPLVSAKSGSIATQVRALLAADLRRGHRDSGSIARRLHISRRTLVRRLKLERTSFSEQLDSLRNDAALRLLARSDLSLHEISKLLGFSHVQAFHRAFKRWAGLTPSQYRATAQGVHAPAAPHVADPSAGDADGDGSEADDDPHPWSTGHVASSGHAEHEHES